jgi:hypothetical protein
MTGTLVQPDPSTISRLLSDLGDRVDEHDKQIQARSTRTVDLIVGANRIAHGLGRRARGVTVMPTVADTTWAWSFAADGDSNVIITCVGVPQPGATVEVY